MVGSGLVLLVSVTPPLEPFPFIAGEELPISSPTPVTDAVVDDEVETVVFRGGRLTLTWPSMKTRSSGVDNSSTISEGA